MLAHASVFHAIADPTRRAILDLLRDGERSVLAMLAHLRQGPRRLTQPGLSQHLAVLRAAGLVASRKSGRQRVYAIRPEPLSEVADWVSMYDKFWTAKLDNLRAYLDRHGAESPKTPDAQRPPSRSDP